LATLEWDSDDERSEREYMRKRLAHDLGYQPHPAHVREQAERMDKLAVEDPAFDAAWEELRKLGRLG
jgi:hypothetical protein